MNDDEYSMEILTYPDPRLLQVAQDVTDLLTVQQWAGWLEMAISDYNHYGIAATQFGIPYRFFVWRFEPSIIINPMITKRSGQEIKAESCLSLPGIIVDVPRAHSITLSFLDIYGQPTIHKYGGLSARVAQHEIDHLNGKLITDYL